jgi:histidinol-phosphate aminotransferase
MDRIFSREDLLNLKPNIVNVPQRKIMLCLNESPFDPMDSLRDSVQKNLSRIQINRYYSPLTDELYEALADYCKVNKDQLALGNGADELLYYAFTASNTKAESELVHPSPSYFDYTTYSKAVGMTPCPIDFEDGFSLDPLKFLKALSSPKAKLAIICNPNNPTGNLLDPSLIEYIISNTDKPIIIDEAYYEFSGVTFIDKLNKYKNLLVLRSFSKGFFGAGLRFGYAAGNKDVIYELRKVMTAFNLSRYTEAIALSFLENFDWFFERINHLKHQRDFVFSELKKFENITPLPSSANFITFRSEGCKDDLFNHLKDSEIAIRDVSGHRLLTDCLRVTTGLTEENSAFLSAVSDYFKRS